MNTQIIHALQQALETPSLKISYGRKPAISKSAASATHACLRMKDRAVELPVGHSSAPGSKGRRFPLRRQCGYKALSGIRRRVSAILRLRHNRKRPCLPVSGCAPRFEIASLRETPIHRKIQEALSKAYTAQTPGKSTLTTPTMTSSATSFGGLNNSGRL